VVIIFDNFDIGAILDEKAWELIPADPTFREIQSMQSSGELLVWITTKNALVL
jgi:hypothetical protein